MKNHYLMMKCIGLMLVISMFALAPVKSQAQSMSVSPDNFVLNAVGNFTNIQCQYGIGLPAGPFSNNNIAMYMNGVYVANSNNLVYCIIDQMLFVEFDRTSLQANPAVIALANTGLVTVQIVGSFDKNGIPFNVDRTGYMTILSPGKKAFK